ncbi:hypothetical protein ILUMI_20524 [Ignelater luminosus]|uniref:Uncharacterized protein n=1 Tax=Ignelater luminosus TaxID=2038154 RepID=A0A8K0CG83_IGNLU|nr:hypothetical protein ILUMI_20524 [Ignelater luminosus]
MPSGSEVRVKVRGSSTQDLPESRSQCSGDEGLRWPIHSGAVRMDTNNRMTQRKTQTTMEGASGGRYKNDEDRGMEEKDWRQKRMETNSRES